MENNGEKKLSGFAYFFRSLWSLTNRDLKKWYAVPLLLIMSLIQPVIWLGLFGKAMNLGAIFSNNSINIAVLDIPKSVLNSLSALFMTSAFGTTDYFSFLAIGMLAFIVLFTSMMSGMSIVWDRRFGFLDKLLSTPVSRGSIVVAKILNSTIRSLVQAAVVLVIAVLLGMSVAHLSVSGILLTFFALFLLSFGMSSLFVLLALRSKDWQSQMMVVNLLNLPLLFASNAFFPTKFMPSWLQAVASVNPVSFAINIGRNLLLNIPIATSVFNEFLYLGIFAVALAAISIVLSWKLLKG
ncbi:ABC transporter permease [Candidatus Parvarchaeota archaeon]|jgi:ABC-2 type transporter.|uniref:ABC transporter permease n=1 Tax=Candidatus Acidifodinimicrobium mancum TaxID=2898728 RepID=A0A8T3UZ40_9ARCH|nr:ABC transporter permease [Candidatus Acidifodinimicrobium mancum]MBE5728755.1 ABC transporter permease [Candidatus Acidifodinimicrobium mancum]MBE5730080.1 ABC transporter permease [Candidatus Acidifodinimicrobium mancum]